MSTDLTVGTWDGSSITWHSRYELADVSSLSIEDALGQGKDSARWVMRLPRSFTTLNELPLSGQLVRIEVEGVKVFEGVITNVTNSWLEVGPTGFALDIQAASYLMLLDRHLVVASRDAERAGDRIRGILSEFASQFATDTSLIETGPVVPAADYDYQSVSSVISSLATMTGYMWDLDFDKRVRFFIQLNEVAPIQYINLDGYTIPGDISITTTPVEANVIIIKDFASKSENTHRHEATADGMTSFFSLPLGPFSVDSTRVYVRKEGTTSWVERLVVEDPLGGSREDVQGVPGIAYVCTFNWGVRFPTSDMPGAGDGVRVDYNPEVTDRVIVVCDEDSIRECARREGGDGHHEMVISASDYRVESDAPITMLGELILRRTAWPVVSGTMNLTTTNIGEWRPGQYFDIYSADRDIFDVKQWVMSDYTLKLPVRVWVTSVTRKFRVELERGLVEADVISFSSQPWDEG